MRQYAKDYFLATRIFMNQHKAREMLIDYYTKPKCVDSFLGYCFMGNSPPAKAPPDEEPLNIEDEIRVDLIINDFFDYDEKNFLKNF